MTQENAGADVIEKDIVQTQNEISNTVNELQDKLQPQQLLRQVVGNPQDVPAQLFESVKRNPFAAGLVGVGALWLLSGKEAKMPSFKRNGAAHDATGFESHLVARYEGESEDIYQERVDAARANYGASSDQHATGVRAKLGKMTQSLRGKSGGRVSGLAKAAKDRSRGTVEWSKGKHDESPFAVGIVAAAAGAVAGLALPKTQIEREKLTPLADTAMAKAVGLKDRALEAAGRQLDGGGEDAS